MFSHVHSVPCLPDALTMMMVREDAFIFLNHRRLRLLNFIILIRFFSMDIVMMVMVIEGEGRSRLFTFDYLFV